MAAVRARRLAGCEQGAELVEFAIVFPVLLMLFAAILDFGFLFHSFEATTNAAREGARLAVLPGYQVEDYGAARRRVADYIRTAGVRGPFTSQVTPEAIDLGGFSGSGVRVTVTYTHDFMFIGPVVGLINGTFRNSLTYTTSSVMRTEIQTPVAGT